MNKIQNNQPKNRKERRKEQFAQKKLILSKRTPKANCVNNMLIIGPNKKCNETLCRDCHYVIKCRCRCGTHIETISDNLPARVYCYICRDYELVD